MKLNVQTSKNQYDIILGHHILDHIMDIYPIKHSAFIITDEHVAPIYLERVQNQFEHCGFIVVKAGEESKSLETYEQIIQALAKFKFNRHDVIIALGGGVIGDLAGFVASTYMRGVDFIQIPTTTLSQIDSSIGGKVAINIHPIKNLVGSFYPPSLVLIDFETLESLPLEQYHSGLVEAVKAGLIYRESLFEAFEKETLDIEQIIYESLLVKKAVVEEDEFELGIRQILNFGHTIGHAIESYYDLKAYPHGACVGMGMVLMLDNPLKQRLIQVLERLQLPTSCSYDVDKLMEIMQSDKKAIDGQIRIIEVQKIGEAFIRKVDYAWLRKRLEKENE